MNMNRPDVSDEDIGMRAFHLRKEKAAERAIERLRFGLRDAWNLFSTTDGADLAWVMGELWAYEKRADWDSLRFSKLTPEDVRTIVTYAHQLRTAPVNTIETLELIGDIIRMRDERTA